MKNGKMDNNEALELLLDDDFIKIYKKKENKCYTRKDLYELLKKELEELEEYRKIMGTPIQDIMKRLKILEILKNNLKEDGYYNLLLIERKDLSEEEKILLNEVLVNGKD